MVAAHFVNGYAGARVSDARSKLMPLAMATVAVALATVGLASAPAVVEAVVADRAIVGTAVPSADATTSPSGIGTPNPWVANPDFRNTNPVEHNASTYTGTTSAETIAPGSPIGQDRDSGISSELCTVGFVGTIGGAKFAVTAGHCVVSDQGNPVHSDATKAVVGDYRVWQPEADDLADDASGFAVVELAPTVSIASRPVVGAVSKFSGTAVAHEGDTVCKLGAKTGLTCGTVAYSGQRQLVITGMTGDHGDSGGPVFVRNADGTVYLVGIVEGVSDSGDRVIANPAGNLMSALRANFSANASMYTG